MILPLENPKDITRKLLRGHQGYKINTQKSITFLSTNNDAAAVENSLVLPQKVKHTINIWFSNSTPR